jgi:hypothetical protein
MCGARPGLSDLLCACELEQLCMLDKATHGLDMQASALCQAELYCSVLRCFARPPSQRLAQCLPCLHCCSLPSAYLTCRAP